MTKMRQWSILTVVAVIIVFAAGWFLLVKPQKSKASDLRSQAATQQQQNAVLQSQIAALQSEEKSLPEQQAALRKFSTQVPDNAAEPTVIRQLSAAAAGAGVNLVSMTPGTAAPAVSTATAATPAPTDTTAATPAPGSTSLTGATTAPGGLMQLPISIGITGTFPNVESFFQSLETLPRALLVSSWSLCPIGTTPGASSSTSSGTGASCTPPSVPTDKVPTTGSLGGTLSATIFYAPPVGSVAPSTTTTTPGTTPTTAATPAPTASAATPAATGTTPPPAS
jgi:Tfp pilus assembly protein PilO